MRYVEFRVGNRGSVHNWSAHYVITTPQQFGPYVSDRFAAGIFIEFQDPNA